MRLPAILLGGIALVLAGCATPGPTPDMAAAGASYDRPGYATKVEDGRLWVFRADSDAYRQFLAGTEPARQVTRVGAGPNRMTIKAPDLETLDGYLAAGG